MKSIIDFKSKNIQPILEKLKREHQELFKPHSHISDNENALIYRLCELQKSDSLYAIMIGKSDETYVIMMKANKKNSTHTLFIDAYHDSRKNIELYAFNKKINLVFFDLSKYPYSDYKVLVSSWIDGCTKNALLIFHDYCGSNAIPAIKEVIQDIVWPIQDGPGSVMDSLYWCNVKKNF